MIYIIIFITGVFSADDKSTWTGVAEAGVSTAITTGNMLVGARARFEKSCIGVQSQGCMMCKGKVSIGTICTPTPDTCSKCGGPAQHIGDIAAGAGSAACNSIIAGLIAVKMVRCSAITKAFLAGAQIAGAVLPQFLKENSKSDDSINTNTDVDAGGGDLNTAREDEYNEENFKYSSLYKDPCANSDSIEECNCLSAGFYYDKERKECSDRTTDTVDNLKALQKMAGVAFSKSNPNKKGNAKHTKETRQDTKHGALQNKPSNTDTNQNSSTKDTKYSELVNQSYSNMHTDFKGRRSGAFIKDGFLTSQDDIFTLIHRTYVDKYRRGF